MAERKPGQATPVGQPRQSDKPEPATAAAGDEAAARDVFTQNGVDFDAAARYARLFGAKKPKQALTRAVLGTEEEV
jgi:hypothetical protein